jgi:hypothetical protein
MPLVHGNARPFEALGDYAHLASNSAPLLFLGFLLLQLYRPIAWRVVWQIWLIAGTITWLIARSETLSGDPVRHIGASGIVICIRNFARRQALNGFIANDGFCIW